MRADASHTGFTLIEVIVSIALCAAIVAMSGVFDAYVVGMYRLRSDTEIVLALVRDAQDDALLSGSGMPEVVRFDASLVTAYRGETYDTRVVAHDRTVAISTDINAELPFDITFTAGSGETPEQTVLSFNTGMYERTLIVETSGLSYLSP